MGDTHMLSSCISCRSEPTLLAMTFSITLKNKIKKSRSKSEGKNGHFVPQPIIGVLRILHGVPTKEKSVRKKVERKLVELPPLPRLTLWSFFFKRRRTCAVEVPSSIKIREKTRKERSRMFLFVYEIFVWL